MVQFKKDSSNGPVILYEIRGDRADYVAQMKALMVALGGLDGDNDVDNDARQTISAMLYDMMVCEMQIIPCCQ